jgi:hypothetical protein
MKTIVAGSRGIEDYLLVSQAIEKAPWTITEVVSGAPGGLIDWVCAGRRRTTSQ